MLFTAHLFVAELRFLDRFPHRMHCAVEAMMGQLTVKVSILEEKKRC